MLKLCTDFSHTADFDLQEDPQAEQYLKRKRSKLANHGFHQDWRSWNVHSWPLVTSTARHRWVYKFVKLARFDWLLQWHLFSFTTGWGRQHLSPLESCCSSFPWTSSSRSSLERRRCSLCLSRTRGWSSSQKFFKEFWSWSSSLGSPTWRKRSAKPEPKKFSSSRRVLTSSQ